MMDSATRIHRGKDIVLDPISVGEIVIHLDNGIIVHSKYE